jgi:hypothetical protein
MIWALITVAAVVFIGPGALWWLVPLAFFRFRGFGHLHHHSHPGEPRRLDRGDDLTLV